MSSRIRWESHPLKYFLHGVIDYRGKTPPGSDRGVPVITAAHVKEGSVVHCGAKFVTQEVYDRWTTRGLIKPGDVLITTEAPVAQVAQVPSDRTYLITRRVIALQVDPSRGDERFLKYLLLSPATRSRLEAMAHGTTVPRLYKEDILDLQILTPPVRVQARIASVLSAYDRLIENNTRRIAILEEMARAIYREWFVNFRFPGGYEQAEMVESVPAGWEVKRIGDAAAVHRGRSYRSADLVDEGGLPFLNLKCVDRDGGFRRDGLKRYDGRYSESQVAGPGNIIMAVTDMTQERRIIARVARVPLLDERRMVYSMDLVKVEPSTAVCGEYLYGMLRYSGFADEVKQYANGANVLHLNPTHIERYRFPCPPQELQEEYSFIVAPLYKLCDLLATRIDNLRVTRDLLLPKLISGEIEVAALEDELTGAAA